MISILPHLIRENSSFPGSGYLRMICNMKNMHAAMNCADKGFQNFHYRFIICMSIFNAAPKLSSTKESNVASSTVLPLYLPPCL